MNKLLLALLLLASIPAQADALQESIDSLARGLQSDREFRYRQYNDNMNRLYQQPPVVIVTPNNDYIVPQGGGVSAGRWVPPSNYFYNAPAR